MEQFTRIVVTSVTYLDRDGMPPIATTDPLDYVFVLAIDTLTYFSPSTHVVRPLTADARRALVEAARAVPSDASIGVDTALSRTTTMIAVSVSSLGADYRWSVQEARLYINHHDADWVDGAWEKLLSLLVAELGDDDPHTRADFWLRPKA